LDTQALIDQWEARGVRTHRFRLRVSSPLKCESYVVPFPDEAKARSWARQICKAGGSVSCFLYDSDKPVTAYRSRPGGKYQRARSFGLIGTLAVPVW